MHDIKMIADNVFLLLTDKEEPLALLIMNGEVFCELTPNGKQYYYDIKDVEEKYKIKLEVTKLSSTNTHKHKKEMYYIDEFPIKHGDGIFNVANEGNYIFYKLNKSSKVEYVAGWWILEYPSGCVSQLNPKKSTLLQYKHYGAYKNEFDCNAELNIIKNKGV